jgi:pimeloyl-ACP methyl ester carboxylesterase
VSRRPAGAHRLALALGLAATVALAGCTIVHGTTAGTGPGGGGTGGSVPAAGAIQWHQCSGGILCGQLAVPLDYAHPGGRKITLALSEVPATAPKAQQLGILLVNPGGPGASGTGWASYVAQGLDPAVAARYNIVGFDTRGVGASVPALRCAPGFFARERPDYIPRNAAAEQVLIGRARAYAAACERRFGWLLPYMTTVNIARDMDQIRAALGRPKLSFLGYSYGTYIGQVYATLFPHRVARMVLDSTVDPTGAWYQDNIEQDYAFQGRIDALYAWIARYNRVYHLGSSAGQVRRAWYAARARLAARPIVQAAGPAIGPAEYDDTFSPAAYANSTWPGLAAALASYLHTGSGQLLSGQYRYGATPENEFAVYNAVECSDVAWPRNWSRWNTDTRRVYATAPYEAWDNAWFNAACAFWPVHGPARPMKIGAPGLPGILMLQGSLDAATPYAGALNARRALPTARMVVVAGGGNHGQSLAYPPNRCVDGYLNRYLATGALPTGAGLVSATCPTLPAPRPSG